MVILEIAEALFGRMGLIIGVQIAFRGLGADDQVNGAVRRLTQGGIGLYGQLISDGLQPLVQVAVLKDHAVILAPAETGRDAEVFDTVAGLRILQAVVQGFPLIGEHLGAHQVDPRREKTVGYPHCGQGQRLCHRFHSKHLACFYIAGGRRGTGLRPAERRFADSFEKGPWKNHGP